MLKVEIDGIIYVPAPDPVLTTDTLSNLLRERREYLGLTLTQLAKVAGCGKGQLHAIESGASQPGLRTAYRLSVALGLPMESIGACSINRSAGP